MVICLGQSSISMGTSRRQGGCFADRNRCCGWPRCAFRASYFRIAHLCPAPQVSGCVFHLVRFMRRVFGVASPRVAVACSRVEAPTRGFCFMFHVPRFEFRHSPCCAFGAPHFPLCVSRATFRACPQVAFLVKRQGPGAAFPKPLRRVAGIYSGQRARKFPAWGDAAGAKPPILGFGEPPACSKTVLI